MLPGRKYGMADYLGMVKRRWWMVACPAAAGLFVALLVSSSLPDIYQSETLIQIVPQRVPDAYVRSTVTMRTEDRMDSLESLVKSRSQLAQLIRDSNLYSAELTRLPLEDVLGKMRDAIRVELVRPGRNMPPESFYVRFTYDDPAVAARVTTRLGSIFVDQNAKERGDLADATNAFLAAQLASSQARLEAHEQKMEAFRQRHQGSLPTQAEFNLQAIQNAQTQLQGILTSLSNDRDRRLLLDRLYNEALLQPAVLPPTTASAVNPSDATATASLTMRQQLDLAKAAVARLDGRLKPEHPDLRRAKAAVADLQARVDSEPDTTAQPTTGATAVATTPAEVARRQRLAQMRAELESIDRQIAFKEREQQRYSAEILDYQRRLSAVPGTESEWTALTRDYETLATAYKSLLQKSEDAKVSADLERRQVGEQFRVLEPARVPGKPIGPFRLQINGIGVAAGMLLGLVVVAFLEVRDRTFHSEIDVLDVLSLPVLATVPLVETDRDRRRRRFGRLILSSCAALCLAGAGIVFWNFQLWKHLT